MSVTTFPKPEETYNREQSVNAIIVSIAAEETALSHILNAVGANIQDTLKEAAQAPGANLEKLAEANESIASLVAQINNMQVILKDKLRIVMSCTSKEPVPPTPTPQEPKPCPPTPQDALPCPPCLQPLDCLACFAAVTEYAWTSGSTLRLETHHCCQNGIEIKRRHSDTTIQLPKGKKYAIELDLALINRSEDPVMIAITLDSDGKIICSQEYFFDGCKRYIQVNDRLIWQTSDYSSNSLSVRLLSYNSIRIRYGGLAIVEDLDC